MAVQRARRMSRSIARGSRRRAGCILLIVSCAAAAASQAGQQPAVSGDSRTQSFDQLHEQGQRRHAGMKTLTARFTETTTSALLARPLVARGTVLVERPSRVALRYSEPDTRIIVIDDKKLTSSWPTPRTLDIATAMGRVQKQFIDGSAADLRREFDIDDTKALDTPGSYHVTMTPKRKQIRDAVAKLDLWVDHESLLLKTMRMTFPGGETKTMTFDDVVPNAPLPPGAFVLAR
jgi:outer membrane lipoprotein-sorting protein